MAWDREINFDEPGREGPILILHADFRLIRPHKERASHSDINNEPVPTISMDEARFVQALNLSHSYHQIHWQNNSAFLKFKEDSPRW